MNNIFFIKTSKYSTLFKAIFEHYKNNIVLTINGHIYKTNKELETAKKLLSFNKQIKSIHEMEIKSNEQLIIAFHDGPENMWSSIEQKNFFNSLAKKKILRIIFVQKAKNKFQKLTEYCKKN